MSKRESGYERKERDSYQTLVPHLPWLPGRVWGPACGSASGRLGEPVTADKGFDSPAYRLSLNRCAARSVSLASIIGTSTGLRMEPMPIGRSLRPSALHHDLRSPMGEGYRTAWPSCDR
jgi:hypothetical protein